MAFDLEGAIRANAPAPAKPWSGFPRHNFVGGHIDGDSVPAAALGKAIVDALAREGHTLATYGMTSGPQGYLPFREAICDMLQRRTGMPATPDQILVTSGSLQALDLVFDLFLEPGDVVLLEKACYGGVLNRLKKRGVEYVGVELDDDGMRMDALEAAIEAVKASGRRPRMIYTIPTIQNPTASIMPESRRREMLAIAARHDLPIFEDDCYSDLVFAGDRPKAIRALAEGDEQARVIYCATFSKTIGPALRAGYIAADWSVIARLLGLKGDGGTGALEQMALAGFIRDHFDGLVTQLNQTLKAKADALADALDEHFGAAAEYTPPPGGIYLWVTLPEAVDTSRLFAAASAEGLALNPGVEWATDDAYGRRRIRLCFGHPSPDQIREGVAMLADICHKEFGVPVRSGNVTRN